jgi:septum formation protein
MKRTILASQSPQRKIILKTLGFDFEVIPAHIDEGAVKYDDLKSRAENIARAKAKAIAKDNLEAVIIAADTYPVFSGEALEKPATKKEAIEMLSTLSGQKFESYTGWCVLDKEGGVDKSGVAVTETIFRKLSQKEIEHYVQTQPVTTWSAAFCPAYHEGASFVADIKGSLTGFTHGLPLEEIIPLL